MRSVDLKLKPFDFANAVARAGLTPQGQPVAKAASGGTSFATGRPCLVITYCLG